MGGNLEEVMLNLFQHPTSYVVQLAVIYLAETPK